MAGAFPRPAFSYDYTLNREIANFDKFFSNPERAIPRKKKNEIDLATWNIANLGVQKRRDKDLRLIAHILSHFDIVAVQEIPILPKAPSPIQHMARLSEIMNFSESKTRSCGIGVEFAKLSAHAI